MTTLPPAGRRGNVGSDAPAPTPPHALPAYPAWQRDDPAGSEARLQAWADDLLRLCHDPGWSAWYWSHPPGGGPPSAGERLVRAVLGRRLPPLTERQRRRLDRPPLTPRQRRRRRLRRLVRRLVRRTLERMAGELAEWVGYEVGRALAARNGRAAP